MPVLINVRHPRPRLLNSMSVANSYSNYSQQGYFRVIAEETGVSESRCSNIYRKAKDRGHCYDLPKSGRPPKLDDKGKRALKRSVRRNRFRSWDYIRKDYGLHSNTARKYAKLAGLSKHLRREKPVLSAKHRLMRQAWSRRNRNQDWSRLIFTDECSIERGLNTPSRWVIRAPGEEFDDENVRPVWKSGRKSLMVWRAIARDHKFPLVRLTRFPREKPITKHGVNAEVYADKVLKGPLKAAVDEMSDSLGGTVFVVEDGAPLHTGKAAVNARRELGFIQFDHPTRSPDLNPIETIWHLLKRRVGMMDRVATTLSELWDRLVEAWDSISIKEINRAIDSMPERGKAVAASKGGYTKY